MVSTPVQLLFKIIIRWAKTLLYKTLNQLFAFTGTVFEFNTQTVFLKISCDSPSLNYNIDFLHDNVIYRLHTWYLQMPLLFRFKMPLISEWLPDYILPGGANYKSNVWKNFKPGEKELYSNIGTPLLALIVENISGLNYMDYCRENILDPLEMYNTAFRFSKLDTNLLATPYWNMHSPIHLFNYRHYPAGNLKSNIVDFSHFMIAMLNYGEYKGKRILKKVTAEKMFEIHNTSSGSALLWWHYPGDCIGHSGGGEGFSTRAEWYMESRKGMIIFTNRWNSSVYPQGRIYELLRYQCNKY